MSAAPRRWAVRATPAAVADHTYVTAAGGGHDGDPGLVNLMWYIDDDREVGVVEHALDPGDLGPATGPSVSMVCVSKV